MKKSIVILLVAVPAILFITGVLFASQMFPIYAGVRGYDADPAYVYLISALTFLDGQTPTHFDHPGTPLQLLAAGVSFIQWGYLRIFGEAPSDVISAVLLKPEIYILAISSVLLALNAWATYYFGRRVFQATGSIILAIICQMAPLGFAIVSPRIVYFSPEALLIFASLCLLGVLAPVILGGNEKQSTLPRHAPALAGIICGFGVAVKVTFLPMIGLLLLLGARKRVAHALFYGAGAFFICLLPIFERLPELAARLYSFAVHSGKYGSGGETVVEFSAIPSRIVELFWYFPFFFCVGLALVVISIARMGLCVLSSATNSSTAEQGNGAGDTAAIRLKKFALHVPVTLICVGVFATMLVLKHPAPRYMIPVLPLAFIAAAWLAQSAARVIEPPPGRYTGLAVVILFALSVYMATSSSIVAFNNLRSQRLKSDNTLSLVRSELSKYQNPLVIGTYRCIFPECALSFGLHYGASLVARAAPLMTNFNVFNIWNYRLKVFGEGWVPLARVNDYIAGGRDVFLFSTSEHEGRTTKFRREKIISTSTHVLLRVTGVSESK